MCANFHGQEPSARKVSQRHRLMFLIMTGLVCSISILLFVFNMRAKANSVIACMAAEPVETVTLYAPDKLICSGSKLSDYRFKDVYWPRNSVPEGAVCDLAELKGMFAKVNIPKGIHS